MNNVVNQTIIKSGAYFYLVNIEDDTIVSYGVKDVTETKGDGLKFIDVTGKTAKEFLEERAKNPKTNGRVQGGKAIIKRRPNSGDRNKTGRSNNQYKTNTNKPRTNNNKPVAKNNAKSNKKYYKVQYSQKTIYRSDSLEAFIANKLEEMEKGTLQEKPNSKYRVWASWQDLLPSHLDMIPTGEIQYQVKYNDHLAYITIVTNNGKEERERTVRNPFRNEIIKSVVSQMKYFVNHLILPCNPCVLEAVPEDIQIDVLLPESYEKLAEYYLAINKDHDFRRTVQKAFDTIKEKLQKQFDKKNNISIHLIPDETMDKLIARVKEREDNK